MGAVTRSGEVGMGMEMNTVRTTKKTELLETKIPKYSEKLIIRRVRIKINHEEMNSLPSKWKYEKIRKKLRILRTP